MLRIKDNIAIHILQRAFLNIPTVYAHPDFLLRIYAWPDQPFQANYMFAKLRISDAYPEMLLVNRSGL